MGLMERFRRTRPGRFEVYQRADRRWAWRLIAGNGQIVATDGGQGYETRYGALKALTAVKHCAANAEIEQRG